MSQKTLTRQISRRKFVRWGIGGLAGLLAAERAYDFFSESTAKARIVIVGGGAAGITIAANLSDMLRHDDITIIDPNAEHHYQPGYTLIAGGLLKPESVIRKTRSLIPSRTKWLQDHVTELNPDNNIVVTKNHGRIAYDFLVLVPGCQVDFAQIEGINREELGAGNAHCIYDYNGAIAGRDALAGLSSLKGERILFSDSHTKTKCGGVPRKVCFMADDLLRKQGVRERFSLDYYASLGELMKPKVFGDRLISLMTERQIDISYNHRLVAVDTSARKATFERRQTDGSSPTPERVSVEFDFLHFVPPMSAPDFVKESSLADTSKEGGWVKVNKETLIHEKFSNVISFGDVAGLPTSKTGAAVRVQAPVAAANLVRLMEGKAPDRKYNGYSACPIITEYGKVLMCEFGYDDKLLPTFPWLDPAIERGMWWTLKVHGLKPMYYQGMLRGWV